MAILIADTDVLIDFLAGLNPTAAQIAAELEMGTLFTTAVTRFELLSDARTAAQERRIRRLLDALPTLPLDTRAATKPHASGWTWNARGRRSVWATV